VSTPIQVSEERGVRYLHFGSPWVQGAMRIARPWALELEYTRELMMPLLLRGETGWPRSVLQVGLGAASITRFLHHHFPAARLTVVEIAPDVVQTARTYFKLPEDGVTLVPGDGADYMARATATYDLIVVDGFDGRGRAGRLDSVPFYLDAKSRLARQGMLAVNFLTRRRTAAPSIERMQEAFGERVLPLDASEAGNVVALAAVGPRIRFTIDELREAAARLKAQAGLDLAGTLSRLAARGGQLDL
jgi:spermidine synthase